MGSIVATSDNTGAVSNKNLYGPFGEITTLAGTTFGFTGQRYDAELGLYYFKNRYYSPTLGRFLQPDPIGYTGEELNIYGYAANSPLKYTDPTGNTPISPLAWAIFATFAILIISIAVYLAIYLIFWLLSVFLEWLMSILQKRDPVFPAWDPWGPLVKLFTTPVASVPPGWVSRRLVGYNQFTGVLDGAAPGSQGSFFQYVYPGGSVYNDNSSSGGGNIAGGPGGGNGGYPGPQLAFFGNPQNIAPHESVQTNSGSSGAPLSSAVASSAPASGDFAPYAYFGGLPPSVVGW